MKRSILIALLLAAPLFAQTGTQPASGTARRVARVAFADLGTPLASSIYYCTDCVAAAPCAGSGTGAFAFRVGSAWNCNTGASGGDTLPITDATAVVKGSADATKLLRFEVDGGTTGVTVVATPPTTSFTMARTDAAQTLTGTQTVSGGKIFATGAGDAANYDSRIISGTESATLGVGFRKAPPLSGQTSGVFQVVTGNGSATAYVEGAGFVAGSIRVSAVGGAWACENAAGSAGAPIAATLLQLWTTGNGFDTALSRCAAGIICGGTGAQGSVAGTFSAASFTGGTTTGTNTAGQSVVASAGTGTGTGRPGDWTIRTSPKEASGTTVQTPRDRIHVHAPLLALTDATDTTVLTIALPTLAMGGGQIIATIKAADGTDVQSLTQTVTYSAVNKAGTYTKDIDAVSSTAVSAGTLTATWSLVDSTNAVIVKVNADSSLTTTSFTLSYTLIENTGAAITYPD